MGNFSKWKYWRLRIHKPDISQVGTVGITTTSKAATEDINNSTRSGEKQVFNNFTVVTTRNGWWCTGDSHCPVPMLEWAGSPPEDFDLAKQKKKWSSHPLNNFLSMLGFWFPLELVTFLCEWKKKTPFMINFYAIFLSKYYRHSR